MSDAYTALLAAAKAANTPEQAVAATITAITAEFVVHKATASEVQAFADEIDAANADIVHACMRRGAKRMAF